MNASLAAPVLLALVSGALAIGAVVVGRAEDDGSLVGFLMFVLAAVLAAMTLLFVATAATFHG